MKVFLLHGLTVRSDLELPGPPVVHDTIDFTIRQDRVREISSDVVGGEALARLKFPGFGYSAARTAGGVVIRFDGLLEVVIDDDLRHARFDRAPGCSPDFAALLVAGNVIASLLRLREEPFIHASAVSTGDRAVALVGASGAGKSTLAAMLCATGMSLVCDDLLRLRLQDEIRCVAGPSILRLRPSAEELACNFGPDVTFRSADDRVCVKFPYSAHEPRLKGLVFLVLDTANSVRAMTRVEVATALMGSPRLPGWDSPEFSRRELQTAAWLARSVEGYELHMVAGPPFDPAGAKAMIDRVLQ